MPPAEVLVAKLVSPAYAAVMLCGLPDTVSAEVVQVATPLPFTATLLQTAVAPSLNVTVPVGTPVPCGVTVAVKVTGWLEMLGFRLDASAVVVAALLTVSVKFCTAFGVVELLAVKVSA